MATEYSASIWRSGEKAQRQPALAVARRQGAPLHISQHALQMAWPAGDHQEQLSAQGSSDWLITTGKHPRELPVTITPASCHVLRLSERDLECSPSLVSCKCISLLLPCHRSLSVMDKPADRGVGVRPSCHPE